MNEETAMCPAEAGIREIWREVPGDHYSPSIQAFPHDGPMGSAIRISVGGSVITMTARKWHECALAPISAPKPHRCLCGPTFGHSNNRDCAEAMQNSMRPKEAVSEEVCGHDLVWSPPHCWCPECPGTRARPCGCSGRNAHVQESEDKK